MPETVGILRKLLRQSYYFFILKWNQYKKLLKCLVSNLFLSVAIPVPYSRVLKIFYSRLYCISMFCTREVLEIRILDTRNNKSVLHRRYLCICNKVPMGENFFLAGRWYVWPYFWNQLYFWMLKKSQLILVVLVTWLHLV